MLCVEFYIYYKKNYQECEFENVYSRISNFMMINLIKMHVHVNNYIEKIMGEACIVITINSITNLYKMRF